MIFLFLQKELKEIFSVKIVIMVLAMAAIFVVVGNSVAGAKGKNDNLKPIGIVSEKNYISTLLYEAIGQRFPVVYFGTDFDSCLREVERENGICVVTLPEDIETNIQKGIVTPVEFNWIAKGTGIINVMEIGKYIGVARAVEKTLSGIIIKEYTNANPIFLLKPMKQEDKVYLKEDFFPIEHISSFLEYPNLISSLLSIFVMMLVIISSSSIISSLSLEKENKTLESLLSMPVKRTTILCSKIIASTIVGIIVSGVYVVGYYFFVKVFSFDNSLFKELGLIINLADFFLIGLSLLFSLLSGISLSVYLGLIAKEYQSAQTYTFPVIGLAMLAMLLTTFLDFSTLPVPLKIVVFCIPFSHPMMAEKFLRFNSPLFVILGIIYSFLFALLFFKLAIALFRSERILYSGK